MRFLASLMALACIGQGFTQEKDAVPPRLQPLANNDRFQLVRVLGTPEIHPAGFGPTSAFSADGKKAIYVEDLSTGDEKSPRLHTRVLIWNVGSNAWPREI